MSLTEFEQYLQPKGSVVTIVLSMVCSLMACFFGYLLYRLVMLVAGAAVGVAAGAMVVQKFIPSPTTVDYIVVSGGLAVILALLSFFQVRLMFAVLVLLAAALVIPSQVLAHGQVWPAVVISFVSLIIACLSFIYLREIFIALTALSGGLWASVCVFSLANWNPPWRLGLTLLAGLVLAMLGMRAQWAWSKRFGPKLSSKARSSRASGRRK